MSIQISVIIWTVICFLLLMLILKNWLFKPVLEVMEKRQARIDKAKEKQLEIERHIVEHEKVLREQKIAFEKEQKLKADEEIESIQLHSKKRVEAAKKGEVPIGAVIVKNDKIIASAHNLCEQKKDPTAHAEILAIQTAAEVLGDFRLTDAELYVTLEPCAMCTGAIINSRIKLVVYSAEDYKAGAMGGLCNLTQLPFNHKPEIIIGVMEDEARALLKGFFEKLRKK